MRVIPVIDLAGGRVVRGVAGRRDEYRSIESPLAEGADPVVIAAALREHFGVRELYVADLDAIAGADPAWDLCTQLMAEGAELCIDLGLRDLELARRAAELAGGGRQMDGVIVALETLPGGTFARDCACAIGADRAIFSLDLHDGRPQTADDQWAALPPHQIAAAALEAGYSRLIVLDTAGVGMRGGVTTLDLCRRLRAENAAIEIIAGGGVRHVDDLRRLADAGCDAALVATALHEGSLSPRDVQAAAAW